jgi:hypothetical protein
MRNLTKQSSQKFSEGFLQFCFPNGDHIKSRMEGLRAVSLFLLLGLLPAVLNVNAAQADDVIVTGVLEEGVSKETRGVLRLGAKAQLGLESNAYVWGSRDHVATSTASAEPSLGYDSYTLSVRLAASKILKETEDYKLAEDFQVALSRKAWELSRNLKLTPSVSVILPITEYSKKYSLMEEGIGGKLSLAWDLGRSVRGLTLTSSVKGTHYDYEIPVAFDGKSNEAWRVNSRLVADWEFVRTLTLEVLFGRTWAWTVKNNQLDKFEMDQSINWSPVAMATIAVGHNRGGDVLRSDGNSNLALYDNRDSSFYTSLELSF